MDHTELVIFVLIVLGTVATFGSSITEDYPEDYSGGPEEYSELSPDKTKEIEALRMRSSQSNPAIKKIPEFRDHGKLLSNPSDQDGKEVKRADPGTVIAGAQLTITLLKSILDALASVNRKIAIGVDNESGHEWNANNVYFFSGTSDVNLPYNVTSGKALLWGAHKTKGPVATGAVGVLTYYILGIDRTLAVMYSVPYDYNLYSNWWNVKLYSGYKRADYNMYYDMYYNNPFKGDNGWHGRYLGSNLRLKGAMASSGNATLEVKVYP